MSQFFKYPVNYLYGRRAFSVGAMAVRTVAPEVVDNDYSTFTDETELILETHGRNLTTNTTIDHIFIKCSGVASYSVSVPSGQGSGTGLTAQTLDASNNRGGFQHDLRSVGPLQATEVQIDIVGTNPKVYEILLLESLLTLERKYINIAPVRRDILAQQRTNIRGETYSVTSVSDRRKWVTEFTALFINNPRPTADETRKVLEENTQFTFAENYNQFPERVYAASVLGDINIVYPGQVFNQQRMTFTITEM